MERQCYICGIGKYLPEKICDNAFLNGLLGKDDEWIRSRTGIVQRRFTEETESVSDIGVMAAKNALRHSNVSLKSITHLLVATCTPEFLSPSTACIIAGKLGLSSVNQQVMCFDLNAACSGFVYGLELSRSIIMANPEAVVLLVAAEVPAKRINWEDESTAALFGDASGAVVVTSDNSNALFQIKDVSCCADGSLSSLIKIGGGTVDSYKIGDKVTPDWFISMQGGAVYRHAVRQMTSNSLQILERNGFTVQDIGLFIPHQANLRIIEAVGSRLGLTEKQVFTNVQKYGNTSSATLPVALCEAIEQNRILNNFPVLISSFGAGATWGGAILVPVRIRRNENHE